MNPETKKDFRILYAFLIIASVILAVIYFSENKATIPNKTPVLKENELLKNPEGRIPEFILVNDIKMKYNQSNNSYEKVK